MLRIYLMAIRRRQDNNISQFPSLETVNCTGFYPAIAHPKRFFVVMILGFILKYMIDTKILLLEQFYQRPPFLM